MKILFISRAYPPVLGGIERQNFGIARALAKLAETKIIANKHGKKFLPVFLPWTTLKAFFLLPKYSVILFGDGVLSPIGALLKIFYPKKKFICIIHGLDITFARKKSLLGKIYRFVNIPAHKRMDKLIMVGRETILEAKKIGIPEDKCVFIPNGINMSELSASCSRSEAEKVLSINLEGKKLILRIARFVPHKGVEWFLRNVLPKLPENYFFVAVGGRVSARAAGNKDTYPACEKAIKELDLGSRAKLITDIAEKDKLILLNCADLFISPNVKVPGMMEGFGITAIEGAACGKVVLASDIEGLKDAIIDGENGFLVEHENASAWISKINEVLADDKFREQFGQKARQYVAENYSWEKISKKYLEEIKSVISNYKF